MKTDIKIYKSPFLGSNSGGTIRIEAPEFTHRSNATRIPHMARIVIDYVPRESCLDGDAIGEYMISFRDEEMSPEEAIHTICKEIAEALEPMAITVSSNYSPRDGVAASPQARWQHPSTQQPTQRIVGLN